jgi:hypothetical protein
MWGSWWDENWQEKEEYFDNFRLSIYLSTTNPILSDLGSNLGRSGCKSRLTA